MTTTSKLQTFRLVTLTDTVFSNADRYAKAVKADPKSAATKAALTRYQVSRFALVQRAVEYADNPRGARVAYAHCGDYLGRVMGGGSDDKADAAYLLSVFLRALPAVA